MTLCTLRLLRVTDFFLSHNFYFLVSSIQDCNRLKLLLQSISAAPELIVAVFGENPEELYSWHFNSTGVGFELGFFFPFYVLQINIRLFQNRIPPCELYAMVGQSCCKSLNKIQRLNIKREDARKHGENEEIPVLSVRRLHFVHIQVSY